MGESSAAVRAGACEGLEFLGLRIDANANDAPEAADRVISDPEGEKAILVVRAREDLEIASQARSVRRTA